MVMGIIKQKSEFMLLLVLIAFYFCSLLIPMDLFNEFNILLINDDLSYGGFQNVQELKFYLFDFLNLIVCIALLIAYCLKKKALKRIMIMVGLLNNICSLIIYILYFCTNLKEGTSYASIPILYDEYAIGFTLLSLLIFVYLLISNFSTNFKLIRLLPSVLILVFNIVIFCLPSKGTFYNYYDDIQVPVNSSMQYVGMYGFNHYISEYCLKWNLRYEMLISLVISLFYFYSSLIDHSLGKVVFGTFLLLSSISFLVVGILHINVYDTINGFPASHYSRSELLMSVSMIINSSCLLINNISNYKNIKISLENINK